LRAQEKPHDAVSLSFVFLPLRTSQLLEMTAEQFMDEFLKDIRMQGHNAVSTRYLRSVLLDSRFGALEACTTSVCMKDLCRVVGTRFLVHGSLNSDSTSGLVIELHVVDAQGGFEVTSQTEFFKKNPSVLGAQVLDFTEKILQKVSSSLSVSKVVPGLLQLTEGGTLIAAQTPKKVEGEMIDTIGKKDTQDVNITNVSQIDTVVGNRGTDLSNSNLPQTINQSESISVDDSAIVSDTVKKVYATPDTMVLSENDKGDTIDSISNGTSAVDSSVSVNDSLTPMVRLTNTNSSEDHNDTNETKNNPTLVAQIQKAYDGRSNNSTRLSVSDQSTIIAQTIGPVVPSEALNSKPKITTHKKVRIASFGMVTLAGFMGGIITNEVVKKSLDDENALFDEYMKATAEQTEETYQKYLSQTDKTDIKIRQRSLLYALGVLGLTACTVSIRF
jgi:hypothetical protein